MKITIFSLLLFLILVNLINAQEFIWTNNLAGLEIKNASNDIIVDKNGNSYITGSFEGTLQIGHQSVNSVGREDAFLAKFDTKGELIWIVREGGEDVERGSHLCFDKTGNLYLTGEFEGRTSLGNKVFTESEYAFSTFVIKYDTAGNFKNVFIIPSKDEGINKVSAVITSAAYDSADNLLLTGSFGRYIESQGIQPIGEKGEPLITLVDTSGNAKWTVNSGGVFGLHPQDIAIDDENNFYITGYIGNYGYITSGIEVNIGDSIMTITDGSDIFLVKLNYNGEVIWTKTLSQGIFDGGYAIHINQNDELFITGSITTQEGSSNELRFFISKWDLDGNLIWLKLTTGDKVNQGIDIAADYEGNSYVLGIYNGLIYFDSLSINTPGSNPQVFMVKYDNSGNAIWVTNLKGSRDSYLHASAMDMDPFNNLYITGHYIYQISAGNSVLFNPAGYNLYISAIIDTTIRNGFNLVTGHVFHDIDSNCTFDMNDSLLSQYTIIAEPGPIYATTDKSGEYNLYLDSGTYKISLLQPHTHLYESALSCPPDSNDKITFTGEDEVISDIDFANYIDPSILYKVGIHSGADYVECHEHNNIIVNVMNLGIIDVDSIQLKIKYPQENFEFLTLMPDFLNYEWNNNTLSISVIKLKKDSVLVINIIDSVACSGYDDPYTPHDFLLTSFPENSGFEHDSIYNKYMTTIFIGIIRAIKEQNNKRIKIFPNPSQGHLSIEVPNQDINFIINIFDINGKLILSTNTSSIAELKNIDLSDLSNGLYIIELKNRNLTFWNKFLIWK